MDRAWIFSSTRWWSLSMYITPTVTLWSNGSPVRPSKSTIWPERGRSASSSSEWISFSRAPSNTGVATWMPFRSRWQRVTTSLSGSPSMNSPKALSS